MFASKSDEESTTESRQRRKKKPIKGTSSTPATSFVLVAITARSLSQLFLPTEIPGHFLTDQTTYSIDFLATLFDVFFAGFGIQTLLQQTGLLGGNSQRTISNSEEGGGSSIADLECRVTLNVGRESNTMMDGEWASSGARLLLPINLRFTQEEIDLGFPGEESLGGRYCYRLDVLDDCISFIGSSGEIKVTVEDGAWVTLPITEREADRDGGEAKLRFFLDFPQPIVRNDVILPAGRVFFSGVCFERNVQEATLEAGESVVVGPRGDVGLLTQGGLTIKRNNFMNLYGALGDTNIILGRYKVDNIKIRDAEGCPVDVDQ